jgi:polyhydroxyalkanoate synthesis regulator phasin
MEFIKVKDNEHLIKNTKSNFIVNTNKSEYDEYIARRKLKQSEKNKVDNLERDISTLRNEITEIKDMLRSLVNGN